MIKKTDEKVGAVLVVGGGVGGMQASLDLAEAGFRVYLVDRGSSIGGVMAQLDKTFPTNDCAMCTLAPRMVECGGHLNVEKLTFSEVEAIEGSAGNFNVRVRKKARYIDEVKCTGCGTCTTSCPVQNVPHFEQAGKRIDVWLKEDDNRVLERILSKHGADRVSIMAVLQDINEHYRYLPDDILRHVSGTLNIPLSQIYSLATFYKVFSLEPKGKHIIRVCTGTACHLKGAMEIIQALEEKLDVKCGGTTDDKMFTLETVNCLGCCALSPVMTIGEEYHGNLDVTKLDSIIERYYETSNV